MKLLLIFWLLKFGYCSENDGQEYKNEERRIAGGGNYGGFIGLTTYGAGPFLARGKYERDNYGGFGPNWGGFRPGLRQGQYYDNAPQRYDDGRKRDSKDNNNKEDDKNRKNDDPKKNDEGYDAKFIGNVGYDDIQKDQPYYDGQQKDSDKKNDDYLEYLGYRGGYGYCTGHYGDRNGYRRERYGNRDGTRKKQLNSNFSNYYDEETRERCDYLFGYTGPTANDEPENLMRPCALDDWQCIRKYFAVNAKCKPAYGPIPDPLYIDINTVFVPVVNITLTLPNLRVRGLSSARIREFYVNKQSGNLVFAIDITDLNLTTPRTYFRYRRTAKESIVLADYATIQFRAVTFTAIIPRVPHLRLELADIHADIQDVAPPMFVGPGAYNSTDPDVVTAFSQFNLLSPFVAREALLFLSQLFTAIYIQENICDFELKIISV